MPKKSASGKPRFEFYTILPGKEVVAPKPPVTKKVPQPKRKTTKAKVAKVKQAKATKPKVNQPKMDQRRYFLQAGSFRVRKDADKRKAQLALLGLQSAIEPAKVKGATWYRVKTGPYSSINQVHSDRARMKGNKIEAVIVRQR